MLQAEATERLIQNGTNGTCARQKLTVKGGTFSIATSPIFDRTLASL